MDAEEFERSYADQSGLSVEQLRERRRVVPCGPATGCDDPGCAGWALVPLEADECGECGIPDYKHRDITGHEFTRERRWPR